MAKWFFNEYSHIGLSFDDMYIILAIHPHLSEAQLRKLLDRYSDVINNNPNLVKAHGALAVFEEFISCLRMIRHMEETTRLENPAQKRNWTRGWKKRLQS